MATLEWLDDESLTPEILLAELEQNVRALFNQVCAFDGGGALLRFLDAHANTLMTIDDIAYHLTEANATVESGMRAMAQLGLARKIEVQGFRFYGITTDPAQRQLVRELCAGQDRWHARLERIERSVGEKVSHRVD